MTTKRKHPAPPRLAAELHEYAAAEVFEDAAAPFLERFIVEGYRDLEAGIQWRQLSTGVSISEAVDKAIMLFGRHR